MKSLIEITDKRTANTAGIHLVNLNTGILQKSAVNADFTELVLDKNKLLSLEALLEKLLDKGGFSCSEES